MSFENKNTNYIVYEGVTPRNGNPFDKTVHFINRTRAYQYLQKRSIEILDEIKNNSKFYGYDSKNIIGLTAPAGSPMEGTFIVQDLKKDKSIVTLKFADMSIEKQKLIDTWK